MDSGTAKEFFRFYSGPKRARKAVEEARADRSQPVEARGGDTGAAELGFRHRRTRLREPPASAGILIKAAGLSDTLLDDTFGTKSLEGLPGYQDSVASKAAAKGQDVLSSPTAKRSSFAFRVKTDRPQTEREQVLEAALIVPTYRTGKRQTVAIPTPSLVGHVIVGNEDAKIQAAGCVVMPWHVRKQRRHAARDTQAEEEPQSFGSALTDQIVLGDDGGLLFPRRKTGKRVYSAPTFRTHWSLAQSNPLVLVNRPAVHAPSGRRHLLPPQQQVHIVGDAPLVEARPARSKKMVPLLSHRPTGELLSDEVGSLDEVPYSVGEAESVWTLATLGTADNSEAAAERERTREAWGAMLDRSRQTREHDAAIRHAIRQRIEEMRGALGTPEGRRIRWMKLRRHAQLW
jgi:hypothetical protein